MTVETKQDITISLNKETIAEAHAAIDRVLDRMQANARSDALDELCLAMKRHPGFTILQVIERATCGAFDATDLELAAALEAM